MSDEMEKLTIEKARKTIQKYGVILDWDEMEQECIFHKAGIPTKADATECRGFIEGWESRQAEVERYKEELYRLHKLEALSEITDREKKSLEIISALQTDTEDLRRENKVLQMNNSSLRNHLSRLREKIVDLVEESK